MLVPKANERVRFCLDPAWLNQVLIRPVHRGPTLKDILPKLINTRYLSCIHVSSGYHNLKLDEKLSYLMTFTCHFGSYRYKRLLLGAVLAGDMFQRKMMEYLKNYLMYSVLLMISYCRVWGWCQVPWPDIMKGTTDMQTGEFEIKQR